MPFGRGLDLALGLMSEQRINPSARPGRWFGAGWNRLKRYWGAWLFLLVGVLVTGTVAWRVEAWAKERDQERFEAECRLATSMIEQKMERYESVLGRFRDVCARHGGEVSAADWSGWQGHTLDLPANLPDIRCLVVAPRVTRKDAEAFRERALAQGRGHPGILMSTNRAAEEWYPVWRVMGKGVLVLPELGGDLLSETGMHPSLGPAASAPMAWVPDRPSRFENRTGGETVGFWFVMPLRPLEFTNLIVWKRRGESEEAGAERRAAQRSRQTTGFLAAFIQGDGFSTDPRRLPHVRVELYMSREPGPETWVNPGLKVEGTSRFQRDIPMAWYGRRWTARCVGTPLLEAASLQYRVALVWWLGISLSVAGASGMAWQRRGRLRVALERQERLSRDLHDGTLQSVYGVGLGLRRAMRLMERGHGDVGGQLADTLQALQRVVEELRESIRESGPSTQEEVRLGEALAGVVAHLNMAAEVEVILEVVPGSDAHLTASESLHLLNIAREALSNSLRHASPRRVRIRLETVGAVFRLEVADDGGGFDSTALMGKGRGLQNMTARVREIGGVQRWESSADKGTRLVIELPLPRIDQPHP